VTELTEQPEQSEQRTVCSFRGLARALGCSRQSAWQMARRADWPFGPGPWDAPTLDRIREWRRVNVQSPPTPGVTTRPPRVLVAARLADVERRLAELEMRHGMPPPPIAHSADFGWVRMAGSNFTFRGRLQRDFLRWLLNRADPFAPFTDGEVAEAVSSSAADVRIAKLFMFYRADSVVVHPFLQACLERLGPGTWRLRAGRSHPRRRQTTPAEAERIDRHE